MNQSLLEPEEHVLSTLERDGSRRWLKPRLSHGKYLNRRRAVAYLLIGLYTLLPFVHVGGNPLILFDLPARRFTVFGFTFLPTDTVLLALFLVGTMLGFFLLTALIGRVWCGWACPQTVYMEFVFRPLERLFDRTVGRGGPPRRGTVGAAVVLKYGVYLLVSFWLANTFLAYFVGVKELARWMGQSPVAHPAPFLIMAGMTAAMMFHFSVFREQLCIIACPYGRLQSVLLDKDSKIVAYDRLRGEPRGKVTHDPKADAQTGDCVDCGLCVRTCPTGIDIREGLQMECVNCTQCMDACDAVMTKIGRAPKLIRYSSQRADAGQKGHLLRPRVVIYPLILTVIAVLFVVTLIGKQSINAVVLRNPGQPFTMSDDGRVRNVLKLKVTNRSDEPATVAVAVADPEGVDITVGAESLVLEGGEVATYPVTALVEPTLFVTGQVELELELTTEDGTSRTVDCTLLGPVFIPPPLPPANVKET